MLTSSKKCIVIVLDHKLMYLFTCMLNNVGKPIVVETEEPYCGNISQRSQSTPCSIPFTLHLGKLCYCIYGGKGFFSLIKVNL